MKKPTSKEQYREGTSLASQLPSSTSVWICMSRITVLLMFPKERRAWVVVLRKLNQREHQICLEPRLNGCPQCTERSICPLSYWNIVREGNGVFREKRPTEFASELQCRRQRGICPCRYWNIDHEGNRVLTEKRPIDTLSKRKIDHLALGKFWLICI